MKNMKWKSKTTISRLKGYIVNSPSAVWWQVHGFCELCCLGFWFLFYIYKNRMVTGSYLSTLNLCIWISFYFIASIWYLFFLLMLKSAVNFWLLLPQDSINTSVVLLSVLFSFNLYNCTNQLVLTNWVFGASTLQSCSYTSEPLFSSYEESFQAVKNSPHLAAIVLC